MSKVFTYNKLPEHQVAIYHDADEKFGTYPLTQAECQCNRMLALFLLICNCDIAFVCAERKARPVACTILDYLVVGFASVLVIFTFPVSLWFCIKVSTIRL